MLLPASRAAAVPAAQTRSLASKAQGGADSSEADTDEGEYGEAEEWEEDEDEQADPEVVRLRNSPPGAPTPKNDVGPCS
jgi:UPF0716 family protein affecting phage T7 exclusion